MFMQANGFRKRARESISKTQLRNNIEINKQAQPAALSSAINDRQCCRQKSHQQAEGERQIQSVKS